MSAANRRTRQALRSQMRVRVVVLLVAGLMSVFATRLVQLQGLDPKAYAARAEADGVRTVDLPAKRGRILDRNGEPLAQSVDGLMLIADPSLTADRAPEIAKVLTKRLDVDYFSTLTKLQRQGTGGRFQYLARRVPSTIATEVLDTLNGMKIKGVYTEPDPLRVYPAKDVAANVLGFLGDRDRDESTQSERPLAGLELAFDKRLSGSNGSETYEVGSGGARIPLGENSKVLPKDGQDLELTLDRDVQWYVQRVLRNAVQGSRSDSGSAVVLNTETGEILAFADYPTFDANKPTLARAGDLGSRALGDIYEPGSVAKVLTLSALLDEGRITPTTQVPVPGELPVQDRVIHDWFDHGRLRLTATGVIAKSSNIGTAMLARQMSKKSMYRHLRSFGLGERTDIGLGPENYGMLPAWRMWSDVRQATISFGQGISVNTLQMATAVNAIANDGELVTPSLIRGHATTDSGRTVGTDQASRRRVISPRAAQQMAQMMEAVTNPETGTAPGAQVIGYRVSGKTGTAQRVGDKCSCYDGSFTISFAGFVPADDPKFTIYVVVQNPRNGGGGGSVGGPAFSRIASYLLSRYGVPPTTTKPAAYPIEW